MALWVFGYGSLLWNPGFEPVRRERAVLKDYHRSFCMLSIHHRGTVEQPGLVLALDAVSGGQCTGVAFQVKPAEETQVLADLRARELISSAYVEHHPMRALHDVQQSDYTLRIRDNALIYKLYTRDDNKPEVRNMNRLFT